MSILLKVISPCGIITTTDTREVYSKTYKILSEKVCKSYVDGVLKSYIKGKYLISI